MSKMTHESALHIIALDTAIACMVELLKKPNTRGVEQIIHHMEVLKEFKLEIYEKAKKKN